MLEKHYIQRKENTDLNVYRCGVEACTPGHVWGPGVRDHHLVHVIEEGRGILQLDGHVWQLSAGDGFVVPPDVPVFWQADDHEPWRYAWVGFHGLRAAAILEKAGLTKMNPIFHTEDDHALIDTLNALVAAARLEDSGNMKTPGELLLTGHLYLFLSRLTALTRSDQSDRGTAEDKARHVHRALAYLSRHYPEQVRISEMARALGLDRSYLSTLIHRQTGRTPQAHLIGLRMSRAAQLMQNRQLSISDIARSVGYDDPAQFSKTFRHFHGASPMQYRKQQP